MRSDVNLDEVIKIVGSFVQRYKRFADMYGDIEDFMSELLLHVVSNIDKYDAEKGKLSTWLYEVCKNKMYIYYKRTRNKIKLNQCFSLNELVPGSDRLLMFEVIKEEDVRTFEDIEDNVNAKCVIDKLKPYLSDELKMKYLENKTIKQIAENKGVSRQVISLKLQKELKRIKKALETNNIESLKRKSGYVKQEINEFIENTGLSRRQYFREKNKNKKAAKYEEYIKELKV